MSSVNGDPFGGSFELSFRTDRGSQTLIVSEDLDDIIEFCEQKNGGGRDG
jgi:hypothetical protein